MANLNSYQVHKFTLAAGESLQLDVTGEYVGCIKSLDKFKVGVDSNEAQQMEQGLTFRTVEGDRFELLEIVNSSADANEIELAIGDGQITDNRLSLNSAVNVNGISDLAVPETFLTGNGSVDPGERVNIAPSPGQREILIQNPDTSPGSIRIGVDDFGLYVYPGETISLQVNAVVRVYNQGANARGYRYLQIST